MQLRLHGYSKLKSVSLIALGFLDVLGAALFAYGLAVGIGGLAAGTDGAGLALPVAALLAGVAMRAIGGVLHGGMAIAGAQAASAGVRGRLWPILLGRRLHAPVSAGENVAIGIDHLAALEEREARFLPVRVQAAVGPLLVAATVAFASWVSALIMLGTMVPFLLGMIIAGTAARRASERQLAALEAMSGLFVDRIANLALIRHFAAEERIARQVREATAAVADRTVKVLRAAFLSGAVLEFFAALAVALVAVYCGFSLLGLLPFDPPERLDLTRAFFALAMAPEFYAPMRRLSAAYHEKQLGDAADGALRPYFDLPDHAPDGPPQGGFAGIHARGIVLDFGERQIGPVSLDLDRTDFVALTGPSGSGKTSVLAALADQLDMASGHAGQPGGAPLLPKQVAWSAQRPLLVPGTLGENLALAAPDAAPEQVAAVARRVGLGPVMERRGGLDLALDHRGSGLSGGERRRIGLARAILSGRPAIFCDEPTADLDAASAHEIIAVLEDLARDHCLLVATHDPAVAAAARAQVQL